MNSPELVMNLSRRAFLRSSILAGGGLVLGVHLPQLARGAQEAGRAISPGMLNAFVRITPDDRVTVIVNHSEMGQGTYTSTAMLVAEELEADWTKVGVEAAPVDPAYNHALFGIQMTGGSTSTWTEWERLRKAGAAARLMLIQAAADTWQVEPASCTAENGSVVHSSSQRRLTYGQLVAKAALLSPPQNVPLKDTKDFKLIGHATRRLDTPDKTNGKAVFGLDVTLPGMLVALVARSPVFGGKVKSFNADKAKAVPGVRHVVQIERGVVVVADGFWPAKRGREALEIAWDEGALASLDSRAQRAEYEQLAQKPGVAARKEGDVTTALSI
jgi:isoquinoline 1-oxidoreductase beta subunit